MEKFISGAILTKGISKDGLTNLLNGIEYAVIDEGLDVITEEVDNIIEVLRKNKPGEETEEWIKKFKNQVDALDKIIEINIGKIEIIFERIFKDWDEYQETNINVINLEENQEEEEVNNEDKSESVEETNEEKNVEIESEDKVVEEEQEEETSSMDESTDVVEEAKDLEDNSNIDLEIEIPVDHIETDETNEEEPAIEEKEETQEGEKDE